MKKAFLAYFVLFVGAAASLMAAPTAEEIAAAYAPVIRQQVANDKDHLAAFDFDGNWNAYDNWQHQEWGYPLKAVVYSSVLETSSHWFVTYLTFHPRRWATINTGRWSFENDLEGAQVMVAKDASPFGTPLVVETWSGTALQRWQAAASVTPKSGKFAGVIAFEGTHPVLTISSKSHVLEAAAPRSTAGSGVVTYRYTGKAEEPRKGVATCGYSLATVAATFWKNRDQVGKGRAYGSSVETPNGIAGAVLGSDDYRADTATMPWTWTDPKTAKLAPSDWFFDPAHAFECRYATPAPIARAYLVNPYSAEQAPRMQLATRAANFETLYGD